MINLRNLVGTALALAALLAACGGQNVAIDAELSVADHTVVFDGQPQMPEITFDPPGAEVGAEVVVTPQSGPALESGSWPTDAGVYTVVVRASADRGGREAEGTLTIVPRPIDVAPDAGQYKVFAALEPSLTHTFVDPAGDGIVPSTASGALGREAGESLGTYAFTLGDLDAGANFALALEDGAAVFTVAASALGDGGVVVSDATVTFDGQGQSLDVAFDPPAAGVGAVVTYGTLAPGVVPVDAGTYVVRAVAGAGYVGTATGTLVIAPRPIDVAPDAGQGKLFAAVEPALTYTFVDPAGDAIVPSSASGALGRATGESLGTYVFTLGDLDAGANFALALEDGAPAFTIAASALGEGGVVVADATVVFHGEGQSVDVTFDPPAAGVGAVVTYGELDAGVLPVDAGTYAVSVVAGPGYVGGGTGTLTIAPRPVDLVPSADQGKEYGAEEPTYGYAFVDPSGDGIVPTSATGALVRDAGESVGSYAFTTGDVAAGANFAVTLTAGSFEITSRPLVLAGFAVDGKTYDGTTVATGATFVDDRLDGDDVVVGFDVAFASSSAGASVVANFTGLAITGGAAADNYVLATTSGSATAEIVHRSLSVTDVLWADKVYDGGTGATASATLSSVDVISGDDVALASQLVGQFASANVGTHGVVGAFQLVGSAAANYVVAPQPTGTAAIQPRPVALLNTELAAKTFDGTDVAELSGTLQGATGFGRGVLPADVARLAYDASFAQIGASDELVSVEVRLTGAAATDYVLDPVPTFSATIAPALAVVLPDEAQSKTYGDDDAALTFAVSGLFGKDAVSGALGRDPGEDVGSYGFGLGTLDAGANYTLVLANNERSYAIEARAITLSTTDAVTVYGTTPELAAVLVEGSTLRAGDALFGSLVRPDGSVGSYAYILGSAGVGRGEAIDVSANYTIDFGTYEVTARPLTITAHDRTKTYGDGLDLGTTEFTVASAGVGFGLVGEEHVSGVMLSSAGAAASATLSDGPYAIVASDATGTIGFDAANYDITYVDGSLTVESRVVTLSGTFSIADKAYDGSAEAGAVDTSGLVLNGLADGADVQIEAVATFADALVGDGKVAALSTVTLVGLDAGNYRVSLEGAPTTTGSMVKADLAFGITIAGTDFATEVVYDGDRTFQPNVTTSLDPVPSDVPVGYYVEITYDRTGGSVGSFNPVGTYTVTVTADDPRYVGSSTQVVEVLARPITIASSAVRKTYGTLTPVMSPSLTDLTSFGRNESFFQEGSALTYDAGDQQDPHAVGTYPIRLGGVAIYRGSHTDVTANYAITFADAFEIVPAIMTVAPDANQGKAYGEADPVFTYSYTVEGQLYGDGLTGTLARDLGEDVDTYAFTLGDLDAGDNYTLVLADPAATYAITARPLTLTTAAPLYTYGDTDLDLGAVLAEGSTLRSGDALGGDLALTGTDVGLHAFLLGTAALTRDGADVAPNYTLTFTDYGVRHRQVVVEPVANQGKTYGDTDPVLDYTVDLIGDDALDGALGRTPGENVGTYGTNLGDLRHPNYALSIAEDAPTFAIAPRPISLEASVAHKEFSTADPDLSPLLGEGSTLRDGDTLVGTLAYLGSDVGSYALELGSAHVMREAVDVSANYAIDFGTFTIDPLPVAFDITNADLVLSGDLRTHVFYGAGTEPIRGLTVAASPEGATPSFRLTYRWTHDADHVAFASPVAVQRIQGLGTYQVTITATSANHVGATTLTVWVTDATGVAFAEPTFEALVGAIVTTQVRLVGHDGTPRTAGPVPISVDLNSDQAFVGFVTGNGPASSTTVQIAPGTTGADVDMIATSFASAPAGLTATLADVSDLASGTATFAPTVQFAFAPTTVERGAGATTEPVTVHLTGFDGIAVPAPSDLWVDLHGNPTGLVFRDAADTQNVLAVVIPGGSSETSFRMRADAAGTYTATALHIAEFAGVANGQLTFVVAPRPTVGVIQPGSVGKAQSTTVVLTGTGFAAGVTVGFSGTDVTVDSVTVDSDTQLTVGITIAATNDQGARDVTVTNVDGGTSTTANALVLTAPTLTANDDGPFGVVEGGNRTLSIANDLLANDTSTGSTQFVFDGVLSTSGVTYAYSGLDGVTVTAPAASGGSVASLTYVVRDTVFATTATATVYFDLTLAPVEALLFSNSVDADHFMSQSYALPTTQEIFDTWPRFSDGAYYTAPNGGTTWTGAPSNWVYNAVTDQIEFAANLQYDGIVSPDGFDYFTFEGTLQSTNTDDDSIGLIAAFGTSGGTPVYLTAHRSNGGTGPGRGWGLTLTTGTTEVVLAEPSVPGFTTRKNTGSQGWSASGASRVRVVRTGDILRLSATDWFESGTLAPGYAPLSEITVDLATGQVTYYGEAGWVTVTTAGNVAQFQGRQQYGYFVRSQANTTYVDIDFAGGVARDRVIVLTGAFGGTWTGSRVYRFAEGSNWSLDPEATIQSELGFPRSVTSVVDALYADQGRSFQIYGDRVEANID